MRHRYLLAPALAVVVAAVAFVAVAASGTEDAPGEPSAMAATTVPALEVPPTTVPPVTTTTTTTQPSTTGSPATTTTVPSTITTTASTTTSTAPPATTTSTTVPVTTTSSTTTTTPSSTTTSATSTTTTSSTTTTTTTTTVPPTTTTSTTTTTVPEPATPTTTSTTTTTTTAAPAGGSFDPGAEGRFFSSINGLRAGAGLPAYQSSGALAGYARSWARFMGENDRLAHSGVGSLLGDTWRTAGENVGKGPSVAAIFNALVASPTHYANMVSPNFTHMGIGVWVASDGTVWTAHVFAG